MKTPILLLPIVLLIFWSCEEKKDDETIDTTLLASLLHFQITIPQLMTQSSLLVYQPMMMKLKKLNSGSMVIQLG